ncbi:MAG: SdrD B-like domain-containing protein [Caldilineaceae bacterium]
MFFDTHAPYPPRKNQLNAALIGRRPQCGGRRFSLISILMLIFFVSMSVLFPLSAHAQNEPLSQLDGYPLFGHYCVASGGVSLADEPYTGEFNVKVPGEPVAAYWYWSGRSRVEPHHGDNDFIMAANGSAPVTITAERAYESLENNFEWYTYLYQDAALAYVQSGVNYYAVSGLNINNMNRENHGVALVVVYESPDCAYSQINLFQGLDSFRFRNPVAPFGPDSEVRCVSFEAADQDRYLEFEVLVGGTEKPSRTTAIWYLSGTDLAPANLVDLPGAGEIWDPMNNYPGREWEMYSNSVLARPGHNTVCLQIESPDEADGESGVWNGLITRIPVTEPIEMLVSSIGDYVWHDLNQNGVQDGNEPGMSGVTVNLLQQDVVIKTAQTDANGGYLFDNLDAGEYVVEFIAPANFTLTMPNVGNDAADSDADPSTGRSHVVQLAAGVSDMTIDAGLYQFIDLELTKNVAPGSVAVGQQTTFTIDVTNQGPAVATGVAVADVLPSALQFVAAQASQGSYDSQSGIWTIGALQVGQTVTLRLQVIVTAPGLHTNVAQVVLANEHDTDSTPNNNVLEEDDQDDAVVSAYEFASIGDYVWLDKNLNGVQDGDEAGIAGIVVKLYDGAGNELATRTTDANGKYLFNNLTPGDYAVGFTLPDDAHRFSLRDQGNDDNLDSDADTVSGRTATTTLDSGENDMSWDAGIQPLPRLAINKVSHPSTVQPGDLITYTFRYTNTGPGDAYDVVVTETVPEHTTFDPAHSSPSWQCEGNQTAAGTKCTYEIGFLPAGASGGDEMVFAVVVDRPLPQEVDRVVNSVVIGEATSDRGIFVFSLEILLAPTGLDGEEPLQVKVFLPVSMR